MLPSPGAEGWKWKSPSACIHLHRKYISKHLLHTHTQKVIGQDCFSTRGFYLMYVVGCGHFVVDVVCLSIEFASIMNKVLQV